MPEVEIGRVEKYYSKLGVAVIELSEGPLCQGDTIHIKGYTTDFEQVAESLEIEHQRVDRVEPGQRAGLKVIARARPSDRIYKVVPDTG
ncbi:MAG: hypothetical protein HY998_06910 [candidate division NC10 bacterium]|nr:hypothetical protein [candidate division NC10 bacterium]